MAAAHARPGIVPKIKRTPGFHRGQLLPMSLIPRPVLSGRAEFALRMASGGIAGLMGVACTYWLDFAKTRLQASPKEYRGMFDCLVKVKRQSGIRGWYKGVTSNLSGIVFEKVHFA